MDNFVEGVIIAHLLEQVIRLSALATKGTVRLYFGEVDAVGFCVVPFQRRSGGHRQRKKWGIRQRPAQFFRSTFGLQVCKPPATRLQMPP